MKPALRLLTLVSLLFLTACFKSEEQKAIDLVKTGYLDQDKSAPVGKILEGYSFFARTEWEVFETKQGKKIVEFRGYSPLVKAPPERIEAGRRVLDMLEPYNRHRPTEPADFTEAAAALELTAVFRAQFALLPEGRFEVSYVGQRLTMDPFAWPQPDKSSGPAPDDVQQFLSKSERGNQQFLDLVYTNETLPIPHQALVLVNEYRRVKRVQ